MTAKRVAAVAIAAVCVVLSSASGASAWWDRGHTVVCEIARQNLNATLQQALNAYLSVDGASYPDLSSLPYAAVWPDYAKMDLHIFDHWHYVDFPYCPAGWANATLPEDDNALYGLPLLLNALTQSTPLPGTLAWQWGNAQWTKNFAIRFLTHMVGDIHQPLHAISYWSPKHPSGDAGGNLFPIRYTAPEDGQAYNNLHSLYDSVGGLWSSYMPFPVTDDYAQWIRDSAADLQRRYPPSSFPALMAENDSGNRFNFTGWALESYALAITSGYTQLTEGQTLTQTYVDGLREVLLKRIALAGYRLARVLSVADVVSAPQPPADDSSSSGWTSREVALLVMFLLTLALSAGLYEYGYRRGHRRGRTSAEGAGLLSGGGADKPSAAASAHATVDIDGVVHNEMH